MHHECGHFWYTFLRGYPGLIKPKVLKPINSDLHFLFPHCNMFEPNDISKWLKILNNNVDSLRNCLFDIYTKILKNNWLSELDNAFKGLKSQKTKTRSNSLKNVADLLNKMTDVKIFGNDDEVAQILGLEIIKTQKVEIKTKILYL
jgi:hypothetical protein